MSTTVKDASQGDPGDLVCVNILEYNHFVRCFQVRRRHGFPAVARVRRQRSEAGSAAGELQLGGPDKGQQQQAAPEEQTCPLVSRRSSRPAAVDKRPGCRYQQGYPTHPGRISRRPSFAPRSLPWSCPC